VSDRSTTRRSALLQTRSRDTRRKLIRTALELWSERGFDEAFEETTAEEIARAAGLSKGTFYFHFAHKEDILLEMPWATAEVMAEEASAAMERDERTLVILDDLMSSLARRVAKAPRAAVLRVTAHWSRRTATDGPPTLRGFGEVFADVVRYAAGRGDLPREVDVDEVAALLQAAAMDALVGWAATAQTAATLRTTLCRRADVILSGAAVSYRR
jgi:AcrR family transcriptional regulator